MEKFKKGDKVRILDGSKISFYAGGWTSDMREYIGKVATIESVDPHYPNGKVGYKMQEFDYKFDERGLELVKDETIVIYRKDQKVIALDKSTGKKAMARCNPADTFDFMTGAKLAFDRLTVKAKRFKVGNIVRGTYEGRKLYSITTDDMTKGKVVGVSVDGNLIDVEIIDHKGRFFIGRTFHDLSSKYFELIEETTPQVKEVKRYAKPGEYIKIVNPYGSSSEEYKKGDILKVVKYSGKYPTPDAAFYKNERFKYANDDEYVVLEGYKPEQSNKPTYYTGKIIFTKGDDTFETGHIYEIKNGTIKAPNYGGLLPIADGPFKDIKDVKDYFTGSMIKNRKRKHTWTYNTLELIEVKND